MLIDRELLLQAWPAGYLAMRGARTVDGWQCVRTSAECRYDRPSGDHTWWLAPVTFGANRTPVGSDTVVRSDRSVFASVRAEGKLLPNVDPGDVATWACLLKDLAIAMGMDDPAQGWEGWAPMSWGLTTRTTVGGTVFRINGRSIELEQTADDPALALVLARIQLREVEVKNGDK